MACHVAFNKQDLVQPDSSFRQHRKNYAKKPIGNASPKHFAGTKIFKHLLSLEQVIKFRTKNKQQRPTIVLYEANFKFLCRAGNEKPLTLFESGILRILQTFVRRLASFSHQHRNVCKIIRIFVTTCISSLFYEISMLNLVILRT